jgi:ArsR family metal-binding transcriptional regulator
VETHLKEMNMNTIENEVKRIIKTQKWEIIVHTMEDGTTQMHRISDGFTAMELLGICNLSNFEIIEQMRGKILPDITTRTVIKD